MWTGPLWALEDGAAWDADVLAGWDAEEPGAVAEDAWDAADELIPTIMLNGFWNEDDELGPGIMLNGFWKDVAEDVPALDAAAWEEEPGIPWLADDDATVPDAEEVVDAGPASPG